MSTGKTSNDSRFGLHFGALAQPISVQLAAQEISVGKIGNDLKHLQQDADAVTRLAVRGYIPDGQKRALHKKLMRRVAEAIK